MDWDCIEGRWEQFKGKVSQRWGKLTDDELDVIAGRRDQLVGHLQQRYGLAREAVEKQLADFEAALDA
jgi:uncharacterized protein YjbJ (UPF0337 family)